MWNIKQNHWEICFWIVFLTCGSFIFIWLVFHFTTVKLFFSSHIIFFYFEIMIIFTISLTFRSFWPHYFTVIQTILNSAELLWLWLPNGSFVHWDNMTPTDPVMCYKSVTEVVLFPHLFFFFWLVKLNEKLSGHFNVKVQFFYLFFFFCSASSWNTSDDLSCYSEALANSSWLAFE